MLRLALRLALLSTAPFATATAQLEWDQPLQTEEFAFEAAGLRLVGLLDRPTGRDAGATILLVPGYGATDVVGQNWNLDLRSHFARLGLNVLVWDKPGCGQSEGEFDINQPVQSSAVEVVAAVRALKERAIPGTGTVGLWGVSRAGWIAPLAMRDEPAIEFWISVSGTDDKENARYLLDTNWRLEGYPPEEVERLVAEWQARFDAVWKGESYAAFVAAGPSLATDPFMELMGWGGVPSEADFLAHRAMFERGELAVDEATGLQVNVPGFPEILASIDRPVLALFGEKDTNVDWRATTKMYEATLGANPDAELTVISFPDANHSLVQCETGGIREMREMPWDAPYAEGYYDAMEDWLVAYGFGRSK